MKHLVTQAKPTSVLIRGGVVRYGASSLTIGFEPLTLGRSEGCNIHIDDAEVSQVHAELRAQHDGVLLRDLGSRNGTFIGTTRIRDAILTGTTQVRIGTALLTVEVSGDKEPQWVEGEESFGQLVGSSAPMRRIFSILQKVAPSELSVLILGDTGCGKELVARSLHQASPRAKMPFVAVDCASIPATLAESILFGHEKGAFTGANERREGSLLEANGGTLFLDELGELPLELQPKLLRALAERQVRRVGSRTVEPTNIRVLAATRRDVVREMNAGRFRSDLFFRLAQVRVELPPLRERRSDLELLVRDTCLRIGAPTKGDFVWSWVNERMANYDWPGNVRELVNVVQVAASLSDSPEAIDDILLFANDARVATAPAWESGASEEAFASAKKDAVARFERAYFMQLAQATEGNVSEMARRSGMERHHVRAFMRKYGIERGVP
jgi:DNA-binding NtrC family response regulator